MNIILDNIVFSLQKSGGISVYWYEIIDKVLKQKKNNYLFIEEDNKSENIFRKCLNINPNSFISGKVYSKKFFSRYREIDLKVQNRKFIFHSSYYRVVSEKVKKNNHVKQIVTVHDFTYEHFSSGLKKWIHSSQKRKAIDAADIVLCVSENTKKDLLYFFPEFSTKKIKVVYNGVSPDYYKISEFKIQDDESPFFLFVGSRATYKNFDFCVKAVAQMDIRYKLKIVGSKLNKEELRLLNNLLKDRWELMMNVENKKLNQLYNSAYTLIYPSSYEGFGIPLLEAMKAGCPFIALNASSISEVCQDAGVLIDNLEISAFNQAVMKIEKNRKEIIKKVSQEEMSFLGRNVMRKL
jgi:mannosyltransferase